MKALSVFAKYWEPGQVKTRLACAVSDVTAARLHEAFLKTTLARADGLADRQTIVFDPFERRREFEHLAGEHWRIEAQSPGSLGRRIEEHVKNLQKQGAR